MIVPLFPVLFTRRTGKTDVVGWRTVRSVLSTAWTMRTSLLFTTLCGFAFCSLALAQPSQYESLEGNLGNWRWGKTLSQKADETEEHEPGETSWERLNAERNAEVEAPAKEGAPQSLSPWQLWRLLREKDSENADGSANE